jgi:hypothetical protein
MNQEAESILTFLSLVGLGVSCNHCCWTSSYPYTRRSMGSSRCKHCRISCHTRRPMSISRNRFFGQSRQSRFCIAIWFVWAYPCPLTPNMQVRSRTDGHCHLGPHPRPDGRSPTRQVVRMETAPVGLRPLCFVRGNADILGEIR